MTDFDRDGPRPSRGFSVVLCLGAAALLAVAGLSKRWLGNGNERASLHYGLLKFVECDGGVCSTSPNYVVLVALRERHPPETISPAFPLAGWATMGGSALAIVGLVTCGVLGALRRRVALPIAPPSLALIGLMVALIAGSVFIATKPGGLGRVGVDWGFIGFAVGVVCGIVAAQRVARLIRPLDPDLGEHDMMSLDRL